MSENGPWVTTLPTQRSTEWRYHTDESCPNLQSSNDYRPARDDEVRRFEECAECADESYRSTEQDHSFYKAALNANGD